MTRLMTVSTEIIRDTLEQYNNVKYIVEKKEEALAKLIKNREEREKNNPKAFDTNLIGSMIEQIAKKNKEMEDQLKHDIDRMNYQLMIVDVQLSMLKKECRDVIQVKYIENNTWEYTAKHVGMSVATCRRKATDGIQMLADALTKEFENSDIQGIA